MYIHMYIYVCVYIYTYIYVHTYTYIQPNFQYLTECYIYLVPILILKILQYPTGIDCRCPEETDIPRVIICNHL